MKPTLIKKKTFFLRGGRVGGRVSRVGRGGGGGGGGAGARVSEFFLQRIQI